MAKHKKYIDIWFGRKNIVLINYKAPWKENGNPPMFGIMTNGAKRMIKFSPIAFMVGFLGAYFIRNIRREKMSKRLLKLKIRFLKFKIRMNVGMMKRTAREIQQLEIDRDRLIKTRRLDEWELKQAEEELS